MNALLAALPHRLNHLGSHPCNTSSRQHTPAFPPHFASTHQFSFSGLNLVESKTNSPTAAFNQLSPRTKRTREMSAPAWKTPLESHSYTFAPLKPFRITSLRKNGGGVVPSPKTGTSIHPFPRCPARSHQPNASASPHTFVPNKVRSSVRSRAFCGMYSAPSRALCGMYSAPSRALCGMNLPSLTALPEQHSYATTRRIALQSSLFSLLHYLVASLLRLSLLRNPIHSYIPS